MSSGLDWDEAYSALISKTTQAYYGDRIRDLIMDLKVVEEPGKKYSYKSGDTQLLSFVLEAALDKVHKEKEYEWGIFKTEVKVHSPGSISEYAETWTGKTGMRKHIVVSIRRPGIWRGSDV